MEKIPPLHPFLTDEAVRAALKEDLGRRGDISAMYTVPQGARAKAVFRTRQEGRIAGIDVALSAFKLLNPAIEVKALSGDGADEAANAVLAHVHGSARDILAAERVALNFLSHMSGIATATRALVRAASGHKAKIACTRKTTPGLRIFEKHAVLAGGGVNHRFGLDDAIMIKDNHIAIAGSIAAAVNAARAATGHMVKIEVEVDTLGQFEQALKLPVDAVLLDNMAPEMMAKAVAMNAGKLILEASGNVTAQTVPAIAATGVDYISSGAITHSAPILDIGLDIDG